MLCKVPNKKGCAFVNTRPHQICLVIMYFYSPTPTYRVYTWALANYVDLARAVLGSREAISGWFLYAIVLQKVILKYKDYVIFLKANHIYSVDTA